MSATVKHIHHLTRTALATSLALGGLHSNVMAQSISDTNNQSNSVEELVVIGSALYRDRTAAIAPQLEYTTDFFQRFEPVSVGDMLKRTPGVAFSSDVGEYDSPQLRGLGNGYTQILINGKAVPSASDDRAFFVDRIPAEIVDRIQIIRSPSADLSGAGIGGVINIILKEGQALNGGSARAGITNVDGEENKLNASFAYGGQSNTTQWSITGSFQERFVPKFKTEEVFDNERNLEEFQNENDVRDSDDLTLGGDVRFELNEKNSLSLSANYIKTKREEDQDETTFEVEDSALQLAEATLDDVDIEEETALYGFSWEYAPSENTQVRSFADFSEVELRETAIVFEGDDADSLELDETEVIDVIDDLTRLGTEFSVKTSDSTSLKFGLHLDDKRRSNQLTIIDDEGDADTQAFNTDDRLIAGFVKSEIVVNDGLQIEAGLRITDVDREIQGSDTPDAANTYSKTHLLPSFHASYAHPNGGVYRLSLARTMRRPGFDQLSPIVFEDEPEDGDISVGNPLLEEELSTGIDIGYEHPILRRGIIGINAFYRDVSNVIESGIVGESDNGGALYSVRNTGDGEVWGIELDMSFPLSDRTGFFANATLLDSKILDPFTLKNRRFQDQPDTIFNVGLDHTIPEWDVSMGFSYQERGDSTSVEYGEQVRLQYDANLEIFLEKRFANGVILRLTGNNLLDAEKVENFTKYDSLDDQRLDLVDEYEREIESVGPSLALTLRKAF